MSRKFKEQDNYETLGNQGYFLLPFKFIKLNESQTVIVNEVGELIILSHQELESIIRKDFCEESNEVLYDDLISKSFISHTEIPQLLDVYAIKYATKKSFLNNFTNLHIFVISLRCEHTCHYCQVSRVSENKDEFDMSRVHITSGIGMMMKTPSPYVTMEFQGGESLLAFDNIIFAVDLAKTEAEKHNKQITFVICTNLAIVTEEMLQFCKTNEILISTSLDGPKHVHDSNRNKPFTSSYDCTIKGIELSRKILGKDKVSALMTCSTNSLNYPKEIVEEYYKRGFRNIFLRNVSPYGFAIRGEKNKYDTDQFIDFYKKALDRIIQYNIKGQFYVENLAKIILNKILTPFPVGFVDLQSPAGMINNVVVFNYDGAIYATDESRMIAENNDFEFQLGHLDTSKYKDIFYGKKAKEYSDVWNTETIAGCSECALQTYCGTDLLINHSTQGDKYGFRPTSVFCHKNMSIILHIIDLYHNRPEVKKVFDSWVSEKHYN